MPAKNDLPSNGNAPDFARRNLSTIYTGRKTVTSAGTAEQLSGTSQPIQAGYTIVVKALASNTNKVHIADSQSEAQNDSQAYELAAGETVTLSIDNVNRLWVDANVNGEGVTYIVEAA